MHVCDQVKHAMQVTEVMIYAAVITPFLYVALLYILSFNDDKFVYNVFSQLGI